MSMSNKTFWRLVEEYKANWNMDSWGFRDFAESLFPGKNLDDDHASPEEMRVIRTEWKKFHKVWYANMWETHMTVDAMPFGGWLSEKAEAEFLRAYRAAEKKHEGRAFMGQFE